MTARYAILHLGAGAFHRAHQAAHLQALAELGDRDWEIIAGNLRGDMAAIEAALIAQAGRYTLETVSPEGERTYQNIDVIKRVLPYTPDLAAHVAAGAEPATRVISMTVTEAGYFLSPDRNLLTDAPDLQADLTTGSHRTLYGALSLILSARMKAGAGPVTLLCCDNLRANGERLRAGFTAFVRARGEAALLEWFEANVTTPSSMVDRITPRPPPDLAARVEAATGVADACPVMAESFKQWVIEDDFAAGRPALERVAVQFVADVTPYEEAKIRILNASHSVIAWAGTLRGHTFIHEGAGDPVVAAMARFYIDQAAIPCLTPSPIDLAVYGATTLRRFGNPDLRDTNERVAADGWAKLATFVAPTVIACVEHGVAPEIAATPLALFLRFMQRWAAGALPFELQDQALDLDAMRAILFAPDPTQAFSAVTRLWGALAGDPRLAAALAAGERRVQALLGPPPPIDTLGAQRADARPPKGEAP